MEVLAELLLMETFLGVAVNEINVEEAVDTSIDKAGLAFVDHYCVCIWGPFSFFFNEAHKLLRNGDMYFI